MTYTLGNAFETWNDPQGNPLIVLDRNGYVMLRAVEFPDGSIQTTANFTAGGLVTVSYSTTPIFNASLGTSFQITLTGNVTSSTFINGVAGQIYTFKIIQNSSGGHTFSWPTNVLNAMTISTGASEISVQSFLYDGTNAYANGSGAIYP